MPAGAQQPHRDRDGDREGKGDEDGNGMWEQGWGDKWVRCGTRADGPTGRSRELQAASSPACLVGALILH